MERNRLETSLRTEPQVYFFVPTSGMAALAEKVSEKANTWPFGAVVSAEAKELRNGDAIQPG